MTIFTGIQTIDGTDPLIRIGKSEELTDGGRFPGPIGT